MGPGTSLAGKDGLALKVAALLFDGRSTDRPIFASEKRGGILN